MLQKTVGIVLRNIKYSDSSNIVELFTESSGNVSVIIRIPRSKKAAVQPVLFRPLSFVEFEADFRQTSNLQRVTHAKCYLPYRSIPYDPVKASIALFLSEFLYRALRQETENRPLFAYLLYSLKWLDECEQGYSNFHLVFLIRISRFLGLYPNLDHYHRGACFDLVNAGFVSGRPFHTSWLSAEESSAMMRLMRMNYETMHLFGMNRRERNRCLVLINEYYRLHLPDFPVLKSLEILTGMFDD